MKIPYDTMMSHLIKHVSNHLLLILFQDTQGDGDEPPVGDEN